jgi:hypothetical protein
MVLMRPYLASSIVVLHHPDINDCHANVRVVDSKRVVHLTQMSWVACLNLNNNSRRAYQTVPRMWCQTLLSACRSDRMASNSNAGYRVP